MKKCFALMMSLLLTVLLAVPAFGADAAGTEKPRIAFGDDGKLTILQVADIQDWVHLSYFAKRSIVYAVRASEPDLVVLTGDNIAGYSCLTKSAARIAIRNVMNLFQRLNVPVAMVFGNHDDEKTPLTKREQIALYETYPCYVGCEGVVAELKVGDNSTLNAGTYNIPVYASADSDEIAYNIWCFDSGTYNPDPEYGGYSYVLPEQIDWYVKTSDSLKEANGGKPMPSIAFQHIAPVQIFRAFREVPEGEPYQYERGGKHYAFPEGTDLETNWMGEPPSPPKENCRPAYAEVDAMIRQGDVNAIFYGHDHVNSYVVPYEGIDFVNSPGITFFSYNDFNRGFRVITLDKNDTDTYGTYTLSADKLLRGGSILDRILYSLRVVYDKAYLYFSQL